MSHPTKKSPRLEEITAKFYWTFKEKLLKLFRRLEREGALSKAFHKTSVTLTPQPQPDKDIPREGVGRGRETRRFGKRGVEAERERGTNFLDKQQKLCGYLHRIKLRAYHTLVDDLQAPPFIEELCEVDSFQERETYSFLRTWMLIESPCFSRWSHTMHRHIVLTGHHGLQKLNVFQKCYKTNLKPHLKGQILLRGGGVSL